jgi:hypothetical protein
MNLLNLFTGAELVVVVIFEWLIFIVNILVIERY